METVGILGGTGPAGRGVALRLASAGFDVVIGSRDTSRAIDVAKSLHARLDGDIKGSSNEVAAVCDIVVGGGGGGGGGGVRRARPSLPFAHNWRARS